MQKESLREDKRFASQLITIRGMLYCNN